MVMQVRADPSRVVARTNADTLWALIDCLSRRVAWELPQYQAMSQYLTVTQGPRGNSRSTAGRVWGFEYLSEGVRRKVANGELTNRGWAWDPWGMVD
jgi:hypothetical protein